MTSAADPDLRGEEALIPLATRLEYLPDDAFGAIVHGRGIDHAAAGVQQRIDDRGPRMDVVRCTPDVEHLVRAETDDR